MSAQNEGPSAAQQPDDGATREAASVEQLEYLTTFTRHDSDCRVTREAACTCGLWAATDGMFAALSQRPRAETPSDDADFSERAMRELQARLTDDDLHFVAGLEAATHAHVTADSEQVEQRKQRRDRARIKLFRHISERRNAPAPRVPEAGSAPNEDTALLAVMAGSKAVAPQPSASTTGEADRE